MLCVTLSMYVTFLIFMWPWLWAGAKTGGRGGAGVGARAGAVYTKNCLTLL